MTAHTLFCIAPFELYDLSTDYTQNVQLIVTNSGPSVFGPNRGLVVRGGKLKFCSTESLFPLVVLLSWEGAVVTYIFVYTQTHKSRTDTVSSYTLFSLERGYNQAFLLHVFIPYLSSPDGIHTKLWSLKTQHYHFLVLMAFVRLEEPSRKSSRCTGIRQRRYRSEERKEGGS